MAAVVSFLSFARSEGDDNHAVARHFREKMGITSTSIIHLPRHRPVTLSPRIDAAVGATCPPVLFDSPRFVTSKLI